MFSSVISFIITFGLALIYKNYAQVAEMRKQNMGVDDDYTLIGVIVVSVVLLLLLIASEIVSLWMSGKHQQIYVKNLLGIEEKHIYSSIFGVFNGLLTLSEVIGIVLSFVAARCFRFLNVEINLFACLVSFLFLLFTENAFLLLNIVKVNIKGFMRLRK